MKNPYCIHIHMVSQTWNTGKKDVKNLYLHVIMLSRHIYVTIHMLQATNDQQQINRNKTMMQIQLNNLGGKKKETANNMQSAYDTIYSNLHRQI